MMDNRYNAYGPMPVFFGIIDIEKMKFSSYPLALALVLRLNAMNSNMKSLCCN